MTDFFDPASIIRITRSMALAVSRDSFLPSAPCSPATLPGDSRQKLARDVLLFFGLDATDASALERNAGYAEWAAFIHARLAAKTAWSCTFFTSGSTGQPCPHTYAAEELVEEAESLKPFFADRKRVVSVMPVHHVFGFAFAFMLPKRLGIPVLEMPPLPSAVFFRELREGDFVLAFPVFWKSFLEICSGPFAASCPGDVHGVTSAAPCPPETIEGLLAVPPGGEKAILHGMTEIYGATEFGAIGLRRHCRGPYTLLPHWRRSAMNTGGDSDRIWGIRREKGAVTPLPDDVAWQDERRFVPLKRKDHAVQVGGVNVFPLQVAEILRGHPHVRDCAVRLMRPEEGVRLKAFVVPDAGLAPGPEGVRDVKAWLASRLDPASMPKSITFGTSLPVTRSGKLADWTIVKESKNV